MRKRLWCTICLLDIQASTHAIISEPIIGPDELDCFFELPRHINDSDMDPSAGEEVPDRSELTDMTMAMITYHLQAMARAVRLKRSQAGNIPLSMVSMTPMSSTGQPSWDREPVRRFEQTALKYMTYFSPESSNFAWFTHHSIETVITALQCSDFSPLMNARHSKETSGDRVECNTEFLCKVVKFLERVQTLHSDPRGEGFKWYITTPWPMVAKAVASCYLCTDKKLLRWAWPVVEASYQDHESIIADQSGGSLNGPFGKLMHRTRQMVASRLQDAPSETSVDATTQAACAPQDTQVQHPRSHSSVTPQWTGSLENLSTDLAQELPSAVYSELLDDRGNIWGEFLADVSMPEAMDSDMLFQ